MKKYDLDHIIEYYEQNQHLTDFLRDELSTCLTNYFLNQAIHVKRKNFEKINKLISHQFPAETENIGYYYAKVDENKSHPGGKLFHAYKNTAKKLREQGLLEYHNQKRSVDEAPTAGKNQYSLILFPYHYSPIHIQ